jgi:hypothetical protein
VVVRMSGVELVVLLSVIVGALLLFALLLVSAR